MKELLSLPPEFDYQLLLTALKGYKKPRDKIRALIRARDIVRVKKGLYVLGPGYGRPYNRFVLANLIYGPSYATAQSALAFWQLIPERVDLMISMTSKRKKTFHTPVGDFQYLYCPISVFPIGIRYQAVDDSKQIVIASPEKALCDLAARQRGLRTNKDMASFLDNLRLDQAFYQNLDQKLLQRIIAAYGRRSLCLLPQALAKKDRP